MWWVQLLNSIVGLLNGGAVGGGGSYESIATFTLASDTASVTFSSIPSTYKHIQIRLMARGTKAAADCRWYARLNGDTGTNYSLHALIGSGTAASAQGAASQNYIEGRAVTGNTATSGIFGTAILDYHDYSSTTKNKTLRAITGNDRNGAGEIGLTSSVWLSTAAISSVLIYPESDSWLTGSTFSLYGIKGA